MVRIVSIDRYTALWQQQIFQIEHLKHFIDSTKCDRSTFSHFVVLLKQFSPVMLLYFGFFSASHYGLAFFISSFTHSFTFLVPFLYVFLQAMLLQYRQFARFVFIYFFFVLLFQCMCDWRLSIFTKVFYNSRELIYTYIDHVCMICDTIQSN